MIPRARYDLVIVGAGLVGGLMAAEATRRGRSVALIEAGEHYSRADRASYVRHHEIVGGNSWPYLHEGRDSYTDTSRESIGTNYALHSHRMKGVGGSTLHWGGRIARLMPEDFQSARLYGTGVDWPIGYDELEPYYSRADWELGVSGVQTPGQPWRSEDFPNPGFPPSVDDRVWQPLSERLGLDVYSSAFAINSRAFNGRSGCQGYMACDVCPSGARFSADGHVEAAVRTGLCDLFTRTVGRRIELDGSGRAQALQATTLDGEDVEIRGTRYVIAAHAVESARLLLLSQVGNRSGQVGRNFMEHIYVEAGGFLDGQRFYPQRRFEVLESMAYYAGDDRRQRGGIKLEFTFEYDPLADMESRQLWGRAMAEHDRQQFGRWLGIAAQTEHLPNAESRVSLNPREKDMFGDPLTHLNLAFSDVDLRTQAKAREVATHLLTEIGASGIAHSPFSSNSFGAHHLGTCRMSSDPDRGVVDKDCRVHGSDNLYVVGGSVFPTAGAMQPSLTIAALALRAVDHMTALDDAA